MYGRGYSDRPSIAYDQELYRRQLLELVDNLNLAQQFDLIGYSLGGGTAASFTAYFPKRVQKLVLISPLINNFKVPFFIKIPVLGEFMARINWYQVDNKSFCLPCLKTILNLKKYSKLFLKQTTYKGFQKISFINAKE